MNILSFFFGTTSPFPQIIYYQSFFETKPTAYNLSELLLPTLTSLKSSDFYYDSLLPVVPVSDSKVPPHFPSYKHCAVQF